MNSPILVIWQIVPEITQLYSLPYNEEILRAHCGFLGSMDTTSEQLGSVNNVKSMISRIEPIDPSRPINAQNYSYVIVCGEIN